MTFVLLKTMIPRVINNIPKLVEIGEIQQGLEKWPQKYVGVQINYSPDEVGTAEKLTNFD
ncbi:hypothetical protein NQ317_012568 [Molorchus minor]|uniref:Uncharacterized protein n=1 Tax=Molorchus minor TaxID=1323400 RepID=A0ABQ9K2Y2_9CUCU|nr:hypothetical protein NQ317_012568 [Molorchus minor]